MKKIYKLGLIVVVLGLISVGVGVAWHFSQKPKPIDEPQYYYPVPDADKGSRDLHAKGG